MLDSKWFKSQIFWTFKCYGPNIFWTHNSLDSNSFRLQLFGTENFLGPKSFLDPTFFSPYICFWLKIFSDTKLFLAYKFWRLKKGLDQKCFLDPDFWDKKVKVNQDPNQLKSRVWLSQLSLLGSFSTKTEPVFQNFSFNWTETKIGKRTLVLME